MRTSLAVGGVEWIFIAGGGGDGVGGGYLLSQDAFLAALKESDVDPAVRLQTKTWSDKENESVNIYI